MIPDWNESPFIGFILWIPRVITFLVILLVFKILGKGEKNDKR